MKKSLKLFTVGLTILAGIVLFWQFSPTVNAQKSSAKKTIKPVVQSPPAETADDSSIIYLNAGQLNAASVETQSLRQSVGGFSGKKMHLVKFDGAIQPEWYKSLTDSGLEIVDYIPNYTYLVYGSAAGLQKLQSNAKNAKNHIQWEGDFLEEYRISPDVYVKNIKDDKSETLSLKSDKFVVQLYKDAAVNAETMSYIDTYRTEAVRNQTEISHYVNITVGLSEEGLKQLAARPDVISIEPYYEPRKLDEVQDIIMTGAVTSGIPVYQNYLTYLANKNFTQAQFDASNFAVNISDSGIDNGTQTPNHFGLYKLGNPASTSRIIYNRLEGTANAGSTIQGLDGHGNINTHIIGGYVPDSLIGVSPHSDANSYRYGLGIAPFVKIGSSVIFDPSSFTSPNYPNLESRAYRDGARISSNSWGSSANTYNSDAQAYDFLVRDAQPAAAAVPAAGNQEYTIVFAAGNNGAGANTVGSPGTGKNVITVGAAENVRAFGGADGCATSDADANSANDMIAFSSRGPTSDGRKKPDISGPGTHVTGGVPQASIASPAYSGTGASLTGFTGGGVCGGVSSIYFPSAGQQWYTASSGTSHSTPAVAGIAALMRQHFINQSITPPTPAMTKALLSASARYMNGVGANDTLPSNSQGMGEMSLNNFFDIVSGAHIFRDELAADKFTASGQARTITASIADNTKPVKIVLAWTDAPGTVGSTNAAVNNLNLEVTVGGQTYLGNVFSGGNSVTGGTADPKNNLESVFIPAGVSGNMLVKVKGINIAGDGVPNDADLLDQDYSLIVSNAAAAALPVPSATAPAIASESVSPANGAADPNETVSVNLPLANVGTAAFNNLTATLQATGGVLAPSSPQSYGALAANAAAVTKPFTFVANGTCGSTITLTFALSDGATSYGTVSYPLVLGTTVTTTSFTQNFDAVTAPALPTGWTSTATGGETVWVTSPTTPSSAPNAAFATDVVTVGNTELVTPSIAVPSGGGKVSFKNLFNLEAASSATGSGFDGMVLEISINGGAFADITSTGGTFTSGGYTRTVSASFSSPIGGRAAWSGLSGGTTAAPAYITSTINLPAAAAGQSIVLKWRVATDTSAIAAGVAGARIDDVTISINSPVCATQTCSLTPPANINTYAYDSPTGTVVNYPTATISGACGVVNYNPPSGSTFPLGTTTVNINSTNLTGGENVPTAPTAGTSFTVTVVPTTAAGAAVSGRVLSSTGKAVANAAVMLTDQQGIVRRTVTNAFGYFNFKEVPTGNTYVAEVKAKSYRFSPTAFTLNDDATGLVLVANP